MVVLVATVVIASTRFSLKAQDQPKATESAAVDKDEVPLKLELPKETTNRQETATSVLEALERPFPLPFGTPTRLEEACAHLRRILRAPVVLDIAALNRQDVRVDDPVELDLEGVRLKTGLKLLLDQVGLTYKVVPEDNLLIITDERGAEAPLSQVRAELKAIHRDLHEVQNAVDELRDAMGLDGGPRVRKPTIIEELPEQPAEKKAAPAEPQSRTRPGI